ncbi:MAG: transcriptional repressor, partial [Clostridiales bacterium]|nr:transcriptional repressor [Clostridiales bacterium]
TKQRQQIYNEITGKTNHYTAEDIRTKLADKKIFTGLSTIYRTLQLLEENNIVKRVPLGGDATVYETCEDESHGHHHMHCNRCGKTLEIHVDMLEGIENIIKTKYGFTITGHTVMFTGLCSTCSHGEQSDSRK